MLTYSYQTGKKQFKKVSKGRQINSQQIFFRKLIRVLERGSFVELVLVSQAKKQLESIIDNWVNYGTIYYLYLQRIASLLKYKFVWTERYYQIKFYKIVYPAHKELLNKIETIFKVTLPQLPDQFIEEHKEDTLFYEWIQLMEKQYNMRNTQPQDKFYDEEQKTLLPIHSAIWRASIFKDKESWKDIFDKVAYSVHDSYILSLDQKEIKYHDAMNRTITNSIQKESLVSSYCLGCYKFFYSRQVDRPLNKMMPIIVFPDLKKMTEQEIKLKQSICALLNSKAGGIILFDCTIKDFKIIPIGTIIIEKQKEAILSRLQDYIRCFAPKITLAENIKISFVPIVNNHWSQDNLIVAETHFETFLRDGKANKFSYQKGMYVTRIRVIPSLSQKLYYFNINKNEDDMFFYQIENNTVAQLKGTNLVRAMTRKYNDWKNNAEVPKIQQQQYVFILKHICPPAEVGIAIYDRVDELQALKQVNNPYQIINQYNYMSLFISKKTFNHEYLNLLKKRNYNVYLMEVPNTSKCKLRSATNCTIMLHNIKFEYLYNELRKPQYSKNSFNSFLICITDFIIILNRTEEQMREPKFQKGVVEILHCEFKDEKVSFWKVENDDGTNEFFIYTKNKLALIYLYFILLDDGLTARFKNPKNFPKIRNNPKKLCRLDYETLRLA